MRHVLRPALLYVAATILYLIAIWSRGLSSTGAAMAGHVLAITAVLLAIGRRRHPSPQVSSAAPFTRTRLWRAFKLFYCIAVPLLIFMAVRAYLDTQYDPYMYMDASGDVDAQGAREALKLIREETARVVQLMWVGLPLVAVGLFYAIRGCVAYIIGRPDEQSVHSRAA